LDGDCKKWRLFADVLNDMAMGLELLLPLLSSYSTYILCITTTMKSIVGVAGGATRAAITQHQVTLRQYITYQNFYMRMEVKFTFSIIQVHSQSHALRVNHFRIIISPEQLCILS
jgi:hypothetical protein